MFHVYNKLNKKEQENLFWAMQHKDSVILKMLFDWEVLLK